MTSERRVGVIQKLHFPDSNALDGGSLLGAALLELHLVVEESRDQRPRPLVRGQLGSSGHRAWLAPES